MCTVNMTFEVPESKRINIEALKKQMNGFFNLLLSMPSIIEQDISAEENVGWEASPELQSRLDQARHEISEGNCTVLKTKEEINAFFDSL